MHRFRLIFYDLDGTLLDSFEDIGNALNHALEKCGLRTHPIDRVKTMVGQGVRVLVERAVGPEHSERVDEVLPLLRDFYESNPASTAKLYPGVVEALASMRRMGLSQIILTNKPHEIAIESCAAVGLDKLVDRIQGESADHPLKPDPEAARKFLRETELSPEKVAMVGDGEADMQLARAVGMHAVGCTWGMSTREQLEAYGADRVIDGIGEVALLSE